MYGVQRSEKYKRQDISGIQKEATRTADHYNNDVDSSRSHHNISLINSCNWLQKINDTIADKGVRVRKDSVMMIGSVYTASKEFFNRQPSESKKAWQNRVLGYFNDCLDWHIKTYCQGNKDLVLSAVIHVDEMTLHLQTYSVPLVDRGNGKYTLSAKSIMGTRKDYTARVDSFYSDVSKKYGLERGEPTPEGQVAKKHIDTQRYKLSKLEQELSSVKTELTKIESDNITADFDKQILLQNNKKLKTNNQELKRQVEEHKNLLSDLYVKNNELIRKNIKLEKEITQQEKRKQEYQDQIINLQKQIPHKKEMFDFWDKAVKEKQSCCTKLNNKIDDLGEKYTNQFEEIDRALQISDMLQQEDPVYYDELQKRIDIPITDISEFNYDDEEIEL